MKYNKARLAIFLFISSIYAKETMMFKRPDVRQQEISDYLLLNNQNINQLYAHSDFISDEDWKKLGLDELIKKLDRTETKSGCSMLKTLMAMSSSDINEIKNRQLMIKIVHKSEKTRSNLHKKLNKLKDLEPDILAIFNPEDNIAQELQKGVNFQLFDFLNTNKIAFTALTCYTIYSAFNSLYLSLLYTSFHDEYDQSCQKDSSWKSFPLKNMFINALKTPLNWHNPYPNTLKNVNNREEIYAKFVTKKESEFTLGDEYKMAKTKYEHRSTLEQVIFMLGTLAKKDISLGVIVYGTIKSIQAYYNLFNTVVTRMEKISKFLKTAKDLYNSHSFLAILTAKQVGMTKQNIDDIDSYILNLEKAPSILKMGSAGATYNKLMENKDQLLPIINFIGLMDAYSSIEKLLNEEQNGNKWSLANFIPNLREVKGPSIKLTNFWLPLINGDAIANSIDLSTIPNVVFTGPNGSGKSTVMKGIALNIVLAQSWGIASADEAIMTPFYGVRTYLHIQEDLPTKKSSFMKETEKVQEMLDYSKNLEKGQFAFFLIDEPYTGTIEVEAAQRVVDFGKELANNQNVMSVIATHLEKPIQLSDSGKFKNLHLELLELDDSFIKTFKLVEGPANWWFEDAEKRKKFVDWLSCNL